MDLLPLVMVFQANFCSVVSFRTPVIPTTSVQQNYRLKDTACKSTAESSVEYPSSQFTLEFFKTPKSEDTLHNFGPASPLDTILYTAERPGNPPTKDGEATSDDVDKWISFIQGQGVTNVIALLDDSELEIYGPPGLLKMYERAGMKCHQVSMGDEGSCGRIMEVIDQADQRGEKIVTHCTGGIGRCGRVCAAWLVHRYNLSPAVATLIVLDQATKSGVERLGHTEKLAEWMAC